MGKILYHYCSIESFIGMTQATSKENPNLTLWVSHIASLNDPQERIYGEELVERIINGIPKEKRMSEEHYPNTENTTLFRKLQESDPRYSMVYDKYILSLSKSEDNLPMWSMYGKNGHGISIGFDKSLFGEHILQNTDINTTIGEVWYGEQQVLEHKKEIEEAYQEKKRMFEWISQKMEIPVETQQLDFSLKQQYANRIKHEAYQYEQEIRLIINELEQPRYRQNNGRLIPYITYQLPINCITKIIIGPSLDQAATNQTLTKLLWDKGFDLDLVKIEKSTIPYRG